MESTHHGDRKDVLCDRKYQPGDEHEILTIYNIVTSRSRTIDQHIWQWKYGIKEESIWVLQNNSKQKIIAHHGLMPYDIKINNTLFKLGKTENTIIHPNYLGTGIYTNFEKKIQPEILEKFDTVITTGGYRAIRKVRHNLGFKSVGRYSYYIKPASLKGFIHFANCFINKLLTNNAFKILLFIPKLLSLPIVWGILNLHVPYKKSILQIQLIEDLNLIKKDLEDFIAEEEKNLGITLARTIELLQWKYFENPNTEYAFFIARENNVIVGYLIVSKMKDIPYMLILDTIIKNKSSTIFNTLIKNAIQYYEQNPIGFVAFPTLAGNSTLSSLLKRTGFWQVTYLNRLFPSIFKKFMPPHDSELLVKLRENSEPLVKLYDPSQWYFTGIFFEGRI